VCVALLQCCVRRRTLLVGAVSLHCQCPGFDRLRGLTVCVAVCCSVLQWRAAADLVRGRHIAPLSVSGIR